MSTLLDFQHIKQNNHESSRFLQNIIRKWDKIHEESGVFRYTIYNLQEKIVGPYLLQVLIQLTAMFSYLILLDLILYLL